MCLCLALFYVTPSEFVIPFFGGFVYYSYALTVFVFVIFVFGVFRVVSYGKKA